MTTVVKEIGKKIREDIGKKMSEKVGMKAMKLRRQVFQCRGAKRTS
jgi:predicted double-glycine peptidase